MRTLEPPPARVTSPDGAPAAGSYRGPLPPVDLAPLGGGRAFRVLHEKRWIWTAIATEELFFACAVVRLGYASNAFVVAFDPARRGARGELLFERSTLLPGPLAAVDNARGPAARFRSPVLSIALEPKGDDLSLTLRAPGLGAAGARLDATLRGAGAPPPISAIAALDGGSIAPGPRGRLANTTEKRVLLDVEGTATFSGVRHSLRGGLGGLDLTAGYLARETRWRWSFGMGRAASGERVAWNLVQGFVGEPECALWVDGELAPLPEATIRDGASAAAPWTVRAGDALDLSFEPRGMRAEDRDLGLVRSRFVQPCGVYSGVVRHRGRELVLARVFGVAEIQDVLW